MPAIGSIGLATYSAKNPGITGWMGGAYLGSLAIAGLVLAALGAGERGTTFGLQLTARWSYCFFILAYVGGPLATLFGPAFQGLARRGREFGLAFASAHLTHLCLVVWLYYISPEPPIPASSALYFGIAALFTYLLALFSIPALVAKLPVSLWWGLRTLGMDYIALAFLRDFLHSPYSGSLLHLIGYLPFVAIGLAAALIRIAAYARKARRKWARSTPAPTTGGSSLAGAASDGAPR
jgi:hypothetical protein